MEKVWVVLVVEMDAFKQAVKDMTLRADTSATILCLLGFSQCCASSP